ncbi:MAG: twin-arginine translocation signal domain-containing protein, partial [Anaerolineae bacterium]|nr:twin-arginine translocation signal domain-containing protein [Anaerolineae bacterium]
MTTNKRMTRRDFLRLSAVGISGAVLAACQPVAPQAAKVEKTVGVTPAPTKPVTVSYATWMWPAREEVVKESIRRFEEKHPL